MGLGMRSPYGHVLTTNAGGTASRVAVSAATLAALAALPSSDPACTQGNDVVIDADNSQWIYDSGSALTADNILVASPSDTPAAGRWVRKAGIVDLRIPIGFATADAAVLVTFPAAMRFAIREAYWEITTGWTGGTSSAIGISSGTNSACSTKGDILGGATGDVAATLVATGPSNFILGTAGGKQDTIAHIRACCLIATDTIRFDRITSAFTAGAGYAHVVGILELSPTT